MKSLKAALLIGATTIAGLSAFGTAAQAVTITNGLFSVGIGPDGELYDSSTGVGFLRTSDGFDPLAPGDPRDSWGVSASGSSAYADYESQGTVGIVGTATTTTGTSATLITQTTLGLNVTQAYSFAAPNVLKISETITNLSGMTATGLLFQRDVDWDVAPTEFNENSFGPAISGKVTDSSYYGFENPDPLVPYGSSCAAGCNQQGDLGGGIKVALGDLAAGGSVTFNYFYAITATGENVNGLLGQASGLGSTYAIATQSSENGDYPNLGANAALIGFGTTSTVPLPASAPLFGGALLALGALGYGVKRRKASATA